MTEKKNSGYRYCNFCKYFAPLRYSTFIGKPGAAGMCTRPMASLDTDNTGRIVRTVVHSRNRMYYDSCEYFCHSIQNACGIEDLDEIVIFPVLRAEAIDLRNDMWVSGIPPSF